MTAGSPLRVAIFGAGPSGFYAAGQLLAIDEPLFAVDLYDRLPTPYGLIRSGVAPDHPKIKSVTKAYDKTSKHDRFRFFGHVELGADLTREQLLERYHVVLYTIGTATDKRLGIPGEDLRGSHPATEFVAGFVGISNVLERGGRRFTVRPEKIRMHFEDGANGEAGHIRDVVYVGMFTRYIVELDSGGELAVVRQNLETSSADVLESRGRRVRLEWRPEHTYDMERPGGHG
jgi:hypothetical protein